MTTGLVNEAMFVEVELGPGVRAGFTTRSGGHSLGSWQGLNLAHHVGDDPQAVNANRALVEQWVGVPVAYCTQVHGAQAVEVTAVASLTPSVGEADALFTTSSGVALAVMVADCVPVLLADPVARVVAVAHVGRAGLMAGVLESVLERMRQSGAVPAQTLAAIGPAIAGCSYEVPQSLQQTVVERFASTAATTSWGTPALDIPQGVQEILMKSQVAGIQMAPGDTFVDKRWYSYRRAEGGVTGRFAGVIRLLS